MFHNALIDPTLLQLDTLEDDNIDEQDVGAEEDAEAQVEEAQEEADADLEERENEAISGSAMTLGDMSRRGPRKKLLKPSSEAGPSVPKPRGRPRKAGTEKRARKKGGEMEEEEDDGIAEGDGDEDEEDPMVARLAGFVSSTVDAPTAAPGAGFLVAAARSNEEDDKITRRPRRKKVHKPSHEANVHLSKANFAFITGDRAQAINDFREVIRLDPRIVSAWRSLASCYEEDGQYELAREMRFCGLHVEGDADEWKEMAMEFKAQGLDEQCLYCLRQAISQDPQDVIVLWEMAEQYMKAGKGTRAIDALRRILRLDPASSHDFTLLMDFYPFFTSTSIQRRRGIEILRTAFDWHLEHFQSPQSSLSTANEEGQESNTMQLEHVIALIDLLKGEDELEEMIETIKRGQRWLQGRSRQRFWDGMDDDREYDPPGTRRDNRTPAEADFGPFALELNLRYRLGMSRLMLGHEDEAAIHIQQVLAADIQQQKELVIELAKELYSRSSWKLALQCYEVLENASPDTSDMDNIFKMGVCHHELKDFKSAEEALRWIISEDPNHNNARLRLASVLEDMGRRTEAFELVSEVLKYKSIHEPVERRGRGGARAGAGGYHGVQGMDGLNKALLEDQMRQKMERMWTEVREAEEGINEGKLGALERYTQVAGTMVESFRLARSNFTKARGVTRVPVASVSTGTAGKKGEDIASQAQRLQDRLERTLGFEDDEPLDPDAEREGEYNPKWMTKRITQFYGVDMEEWLGLIIKYCCILMVRQELQSAMDILEHTIWAGLFNNKRCEVAFRLTMIACAMRMRSHQRVADNCRRLTQIHQFRPEPILLMLGCLGGGGLRAAAAFQETTLQKFLLRELRLYDSAASGGRFHYSLPHARWAEERQTGLTARLGDEIVWQGEEAVWRKGARFRIGQEGGKGEGEWDGQEEEDGAEEGEGEEEDHDEGANDRRDQGLREDGTAENEDVGAEAGENAGENMDEVPGVPPKPTKYSPVWNTMFGQLMMSSRSHHTALFYLIRAYEQNPYDPFICLLIAQGYFSRSLNRQADNRNQFVAQGLAFLARYRKLSPQDAVSQEEVDYNFGRAFHHVGIPHLAAKHYEKVLSSVKVRMREAGMKRERMGHGEDMEMEMEGSEWGEQGDLSPDAVRKSSLAYEAAHNLMLIYAASGSTELIRVKSKWLAI